MVTIRSVLVVALCAIVNGLPVRTSTAIQEVSRAHISLTQIDSANSIAARLWPGKNKTQPAGRNLLNPEQPEISKTVGSTVSVNANETTLSKRQGRFPLYGEESTFLTILNATPYRWKRGYIHSYHMGNWDTDWPEYVEPGQPATTKTRACGDALNCQDSAAEVEYYFEGTEKPMSIFTKMRSTHHNPIIDVEFRGELASLNNGPNSAHKLEFLRYPSGSGFVVSGTEGDFITNDGPLNWMQAMLPELKDIPLREIILPRSHHAGLWKGKRVLLGEPANSQTQFTSLPHQLGNGGIRVLDFRAALHKKGKFHESHLTKLVTHYHGMIGASLDEMIDNINEFNRNVPGELVIIDVHVEAIDARKSDSRLWKELSVNDRRLLYKALERLEHRVSVPDNEDISTWELNRFIGNKTSAVLVNFHSSWHDEDPEGFPGGAEGFVTGTNLPLTHRWSNMDQVNSMVEDQVQAFHELRPHRDRPIHIADWILTQKGINVVLGEPSLITLSTDAWAELYQRLWTESTSESYPNWIAVDNVQGNMHKSIVMAMNHCLVARKCGSLGGKVTFLNE